MSSDSTAHAIELYKSLVESSKSPRGIKEALEYSFELDHVLAIEWFQELSNNPRPETRFWIQSSLFNLLTRVAEKDKKAASAIFSNLLSPKTVGNQALTSGFFPDEKLVREPIRDNMVIWMAKDKIVPLFRIGPKEFLKATINLVLQYQNTVESSAQESFQEDFSYVWYAENSPYEETNLLRSIEAEAKKWAIQSDPRLSEVIETLDLESFVLAKRVLVSVLLSNVKNYYHELYRIVLTRDCLSSYGLLDLIPIIIHDISPHLSTNEVAELNAKFFSFVSEKLRPESEAPFRKFLLESIPTTILSESNSTWLKTTGANYRSLLPEGGVNRSLLFKVFTGEPSTNKDPKFEELKADQQKAVIIEALASEKSFSKSDRISLLRNIEQYLNHKDIPGDTLLQLENVVFRYCQDADPPPDDQLTVEQDSGSFLFTYDTVRALAASCLLKLTWHNPTEQNISYSLTMSEDRNSYVREAICRNLRFLSTVDHSTSMEIARKYADDNRRVSFFLSDYLSFIVSRHDTDALELCTKLLQNFGGIKQGETQRKEPILDFVVSLIVYMALKSGKSEFVKLLDQLILEANRNIEVKKAIAFTCKSEDLLFDEALHRRIIEIYKLLIEHSSPTLRDYATFHLLYSLTEKKVSYLPEVKPILEILSKESYREPSSLLGRPYLIDYLLEFWKEIPEDTIRFLSSLYDKNPSFVYDPFKTDQIIKLIGTLWDYQTTSTFARKELKRILIRFVEAGLPQAITLLRMKEHIEN